MKILNYSRRITGIILSLILILSSCSSTKKTALSCPELPGYHKNQKFAFKHNLNNRKVFAFSHSGSHERNSPAKRSKLHHKDNARAYVTGKEPNLLTKPILIPLSDGPGDLSKSEFSDNLVASIDNSIIPFVKSSSDSNTEKAVNHKNAGKRIFTLFRGPLKSNSDSDIKLNANPENGQSQVTVSENNSVQYVMPPKVHGLAVAGLILGVVGLFVAGIPLGLLATIFGAVALSKIKLYPERFSGRGLAIASIILGIAAIVGAIIVLAVI